MEEENLVSDDTDSLSDDTDTDLESVLHTSDRDIPTDTFSFDYALLNSINDTLSSIEYGVYFIAYALILIFIGLLVQTLFDRF